MCTIYFSYLTISDLIQYLGFVFKFQSTSPYTGEFKVIMLAFFIALYNYLIMSQT